MALAMVGHLFILSSPWTERRQDIIRNSGMDNKKANRGTRGLPHRRSPLRF